ncbi:unnamed protein product [Ixodes persulcatus]
MLLQIAPELETSSPRELNSQRLPFLKHVITIGNDRMPGSITFNDLMNSASAEDHATMKSVSAKVQFDQDAFIQFSSGTTGLPKPVRLTHFNVVNNANIGGRCIGYHQKHEIICMNADLIYGFGRTIGVLGASMFGSTLLMPGARFSPKVTLEAITKHRCTIATGSTTIFFDIIREFEDGTYDVSSLRKAIMAGSLCNPAIVEKIRTRLNAQAVYVHVEDAPKRMMRGLHIRGVSTTRRRNGTQELRKRGVRPPDCITENAYGTTVEEAAKLAPPLVDMREKQQRIGTSGKQTSTLELEHSIQQVSTFEEYIVIGVPDEVMVEKICVWIKVKPDKTLTPEDIKIFCKAKELPWYKIPEYVLFVDSFPRTQTGKVQKQKMREESKQLLNL